MPIYEFECTACNTVFERLQKLSDPDPTVCPECGKTHVKRRLTAPAFRLAGSGWYETDFKKDGDKKRNLADKDHSSSSSDDKPSTSVADGGGKSDSAKSESKGDAAKSDSAAVSPAPAKVKPEGSAGA